VKSTSLIFILFPVLCFANLNFGKDFSLNRFEFEKFKPVFNKKFFEGESPKVIDLDNKKYEIHYTINEVLEKQVKRYLRRYRSDYASVVIIDNNTGKLLAAIDYTRSTKKFGRSLTFSSTNPAASVFKVITAADLLENKKITKNTKFTYSGKGSTLYKYQLKNKKNRWSRSIPFKKAFAYSNNVIFGKAAQKNTTATSITKTANKFGFNDDLFKLLDMGESQVLSSSTQFGLAELASGFNKATMISPTHGAIIASVIANQGVLKNPKVVTKVNEVGRDRVLWKPESSEKIVLTKESAKELNDMMRLTVKSGTARGAFRPWKMKRIKHIEVAGKTGSITGGIPFGKRDWFVSYAKPNNKAGDAGISVSVMNVNVKKWYIKSSYLAKKIIQYYYDGLEKDEYKLQQKINKLK
jgi:cell division protein FtsI/penicillin-binding protein 2